MRVMKDYRPMLFQLTLVVNAIRYFRGELVGACLESGIGYHTLTDVPGYYGVALNPALGDMLPPMPRDDSTLFNRITIHDRAGLNVRTEHLYDREGSSCISEQDALWWWEWIREYVLVNETPYPRLKAMRDLYMDYINDIESKWALANN